VAESFREKRRRELSGQLSTGPAAATQAGGDGQSFRQQRIAELNGTSPVQISQKVSAFQRLNVKEEAQYNADKAQETSTSLKQRLPSEDRAALSVKIKPVVKPTVSSRMAHDPIARTIGAVDDLAMRAANRVGDWLGLGRGLAKSNPKLQEQSPQFLKDAYAPILKEPTTTAQKTADIVGEGLSYIQPTKLAYKALAKTGLKKAVPVLGKLLTGIAAEGGVQAAKETAAAATGLDNKTLVQRALDVGLAGGLGGAGEAAVPLVRAGLNKGVQTVKEALTGGQGKQMGTIDSIMRSNLPTNVKRGGVLPKSAASPMQGVKEIAAHAPEQISTAPVKQDIITRLFGDQNLGITPLGSTKSNRMVTTEQQIVNNPLKNNVQGAIQSFKQGTRAAYQNQVDHLAPLRSINKETYNAGMDANRATSLANTLIHDKFVDNQGNVIGDSLNDVMKTARGLGKKLDDYLVLRHAETRMSRGERVYDESLNMTPELARQKAMDMEARHPGLKEAGDQWDNFNGNVLDSAVNEGLLSKEARDSMRAENPHYASMRRQFTVGEKLAQPKFGNGGSGFSGQSAPIKAVSPTGSTRKIVSPIRSAIEQVNAWKTAELRNRTMQEVTKAIQLDPEAMKGIAEIVKKPSTSYQSLDDALRQGGSEEFLQQLDNDFKSLFKPAKTGEENIVRAMVEGKPVYIKVHNQEAVKALLGMGQESSGYILRAFQKLSNATKRGATGLLAPMFAVKNLTADVVQGAIQSPNAIKHVAIDLPHAVISSLGDVFHIPGLKNLAEEFRRTGGEYSALLRGDRALNKSVMSLRKEAPLSLRGIAKGTVMAAKAPFKALEKVSDITENANRMAAYRRSLVGQQRTPENVRNAINAARESTTNFSRRGAMARETEAFIPYNNAAIQSMYRLTKAFSNPKTALKTVAGIGTLIVGPKLYEYAQFHNDPDYKLLPARERYRNIIISKNADGTFNKQPMPPEYEAMGGFVTDTLRRVIDKDPNAYKGTLDALANAYTPPWMSGALQGYTQGGGPEQSLKGAANATVFAPVQAVIGNQSFTGAPIVSQRLQGNSPGQQYDERTSTPAKWLGDKLGLSPLKADYLLRSYGGDPARLLLPMVSDVGAGTPRNTILKNFIVDPVFTNTLSNDFYTMKQRITQAESDNNTNGTAMPAWYNQDAADYATNMKKAGITKQLSVLNGQKRDIQGDKLMTSKMKAQKLRDIQSQINKIYLEANTKLQASGVPLVNR
jgi:hypothetical protein